MLLHGRLFMVSSQHKLLMTLETWKAGKGPINAHSMRRAFWKVQYSYCPSKWRDPSRQNHERVGPSSGIISNTFRCDALCISTTKWKLTSLDHWNERCTTRSIFLHDSRGESSCYARRWYHWKELYPCSAVFRQCSHRYWKAFNILTSVFQMIEDVENEMICLQKLAVILNEVGDTQARDLVARRFCLLKDSV